MKKIDLPVGDLLEELLLLSREHPSPTRDQWLDTYSKLADLRGDENRAWNGHLEANTDLILRALEAEQVKTVEAFGKTRAGGALHMQVSLSRYWILSSYELLRTCCDNQICEHGSAANQQCDHANCFGCRVVRLKKEFARIRMPLAKFEPQARRNNGEIITIRHFDKDETTEITKAYLGKGRYHPDIMIDIDSGSLGWTFYDHVTGQPCLISRQKLSDEFVGLGSSDI